MTSRVQHDRFKTRNAPPIALSKFAIAPMSPSPHLPWPHYILGSALPWVWMWFEVLRAIIFFQRKSLFFGIIFDVFYLLPENFLKLNDFGQGQNSFFLKFLFLNSNLAGRFPGIYLWADVGEDTCSWFYRYLYKESRALVGFRVYATRTYVCTDIIYTNGYKSDRYWFAIVIQKYSK